MSKYKPHIVGGYPLSSREILRFSARTRLMCPTCGLISNNHIVVEGSYHRGIYHGHSSGDVVLHKCKSCGYVDNDGNGFTDSGNYESDETDRLYEREEELNKKKREVQFLEASLKESLRRWDELWSTDEDAQG